MSYDIAKQPSLTQLVKENQSDKNADKSSFKLSPIEPKPRQVVSVDPEYNVNLVLTWRWDRTLASYIGLRDHQPTLWRLTCGRQMHLLFALFAVFAHQIWTIWEHSIYTVFLIIPPVLFNCVLYILVKDLHFVYVLFRVRGTIYVSWFAIVVISVLSFVLVEQTNKQIELLTITSASVITTLRDAFPPALRRSNGRWFTVIFAMVTIVEYLSVVLGVIDVKDFRFTASIPSASATFEYSTRQLMGDSLFVLSVLAVKQSVVEWVNIHNTRLLMISHEVYCVDPGDPEKNKESDTFETSVQEHQTNS